jgi:lipopolysaccharide/colanic/teichoic acid biosynthesis glycosyltransferase
MIRIFDIFLCSIAILVLFPILLLIATILKFTGEGEVFYLQSRVGYEGEKFKLMKFATMLKNSEKIGSGSITLKNDPRILPIGKFLRKTKINEIPQLINVIIGDMSIIGPRPLTDDTFNLYSDHVKQNIVKLKPGLSGVGSIFFRNEEKYLSNEKNSLETYSTMISPYKGDLELWYLENESFKNYLICILLTIYSIFFDHRNALFKIFKDLPAPNRELNKIIESE